ncbi:MAG TPA: redoxin domain-containing protein [Acidobacteriota bacterium]|nr:redoxin domain-containing protein [Acidobacteriota bacterium]
MRSTVALFTIAAFCFIIALAQAEAAVKVGDTVTDFALTDVRTGKEISLRDLKGPAGVALIFIATECPYSNAFNKVMADLAKEYKAKGINVVGINPNKTEPADAVKRHADNNGLDFVVLKDSGAIADQFGATRTPEVFLLDSQMTVRYHGAIGNSKLPTTKAEQARADDLRPALDAVIQGAPVEVAQTKAFGCTIKR